MTQDATSRRSRRPWRAMAPTVVVVGLGLVWSLAWLVGAWWVERGLAETRAALAAEGIALDCASEDIAGYPFRFTFDCRGVTLTTPDGTLALERLAATIQAYDPRRAIAELQGPARADAGGVALEAGWTRLLVSARTEFGLLRALVAGETRDPLDLLTEVGLTSADLSVRSAGATLGAERLAVFARPAPDTRSRDVEIAADIAAFEAEALGEAVDAVLRARLFALPDAIGSDFAARWLGDGGSIGITRLDLASDAALVRASGQVAAGPLGAADGAITVAVAAPNAVAPLILDEATRAIIAGVANALLIAGRPVELDGRDALALDVTITEGAARIGVLPLGILPPVF